MSRIILFVICHILLLHLVANAQPETKPKIVVGIVVDQMRWDFLYRYQNEYTSGGFKRLLQEGFSAENTLIPYLPTYTAVGHTCIYTGSVPAISGIIGNNWFLKHEHKSTYCTDDNTVNGVGTTAKEAKMSPRNLMVTTICDELKLANQFKSKTIGVALKDRGAILPAGHSANAAYWFDNETGNWVTSTFYRKELPKWAEKFNNKNLPEKYIKENWELSTSAKKYASQSTGDDKPYEASLTGEDNTFPHITSKIDKDKRMAALRQTPFGNTLTFEMAKAAIEGEGMGEGAATDFLAISFSSTDYVGHAFGPNSIEIQDTYLRFDEELKNFLLYLDAKFGKNNYLVFLSADHGVAHIPGFMQENKIPAGAMNENDLKKEMNQVLQSKFAVEDMVDEIMNNQVFINHEKINQWKLEDVKFEIIGFLMSRSYVQSAVDLLKISTTTLVEPIKTMLTNGYNQKLSGDVQFILNPQYIDGGSKGTTHGAWNPYDSHIPLVFMGYGIKPGKTNRETYMTDIAPTLAAILKIQMPNGCIGKVITEALP